MKCNLKKKENEIQTAYFSWKIALKIKILCFHEVTIIPSTVIL